MKLKKHISFKLGVRTYTPILAAALVTSVLVGVVQLNKADGLAPLDQAQTDNWQPVDSPASSDTETAAADEAAMAATLALTQNTIVTPPYVPTAAASPRGLNLYVDSALAAQGRPSQIASQPTASWLGEWSGDVQAAANALTSNATAQNAIPTIVAYNIPVRDCGSYSAGGANSSEYYKSWIRQLAAGIGQRKAIVILEPDALSQIGCLNGNDQAARYTNLSDAVSVLASQTGASVYLDAGHSNWVSANDMADRLKKANVAAARGFALNVSNFQTTGSSDSYGDRLTGLINKPYVVDTSRSGNGSNGEWCNPRGRALGERPSTNVGGNIDAYLWVKIPGESDGSCNGGPPAGMWWDEYAQELIRNAH